MAVVVIFFDSSACCCTGVNMSDLCEHKFHQCLSAKCVWTRQTYSSTEPDRWIFPLSVHVQGTYTEVILSHRKTVTVTKPSVCPLSVWWDSGEIAVDIGRIFLHFDRERTPRSTYRDRKVTGGSRYSLAPLKRWFFFLHCFFRTRGVEVRKRWFIYQMQYLRWYLQQQYLVEITRRDGVCWHCNEIGKISLLDLKETGLSIELFAGILWERQGKWMNNWFFRTEILEIWLDIIWGSLRFWFCGDIWRSEDVWSEK